MNTERSKRVVLYKESGRYWICEKTGFDEIIKTYIPPRGVADSLKEFELEAGWFNVLYPAQHTLGAQAVLKEIYEDWADGN